MAVDVPQQKVVVCPLCAKAVRYWPEQEDADTAFAKHQTASCDPSNYDKVHNKRRCPVPGCKEKLAAANVYRCRGCGVEVCLKHRYQASDHACPGRPVPTQSSAARQQLGSLLRGLRMSGASAAVPSPAAALARRQASAPGQQSPSSTGGSSSGRSGGSGVFSRAAATLQGWRDSLSSSSQSDPAGLVRGSMARRQQPHPPLQHSRKVATAQAPATGRPVEVCADCGARFDSIGELIAHAEAAHIGAAR